MARDPSSSAEHANNKYLQRVYHLSGQDETKDLYNEWATQYDKDLGTSYASPRRCVEAVLANLNSEDASEIKVLDAGCGTGLVGECLAKASTSSRRFVVDGIDLVQGMLDVAKAKGVYRDLDTADMNKPIEKADGSYDVVTCVGTLTKAHVGPVVLKEFARVAKTGGLIVATVHDDIFESDGYKAEVDNLGEKGVIDVISYNEFGFMADSSEGGRMLVLRKK